MNSITAGFSQSTLDVSLQTLGDLDSLISLVIDNNLASVDYDFKGGEQISFNGNNNAVANLIKERGYKFSTGFPEVQNFGSYNSDYNNDFNS